MASPTSVPAQHHDAMDRAVGSFRSDRSKARLLPPTKRRAVPNQLPCSFCLPSSPAQHFANGNFIEVTEPQTDRPRIPLGCLSRSHRDQPRGRPVLLPPGVCMCEGARKIRNCGSAQAAVAVAAESGVCVSGGPGSSSRERQTTAPPVSLCWLIPHRHGTCDMAAA